MVLLALHNNMLTPATTPAYTVALTSYRFRSDDGGEVAATWLAAADTSIARDPGDQFRCRYVVRETGVASSTDWNFFDWQYRVNGGAWTSPGVPAAVSGAIICADSPHFAQSVSAATQQLGQGSYNTGYLGNPGMISGESAGQYGVGGYIEHLTNTETETEIVLKLLAGYDWADGDVVELRVRAGATEASPTPEPPGSVASIATFTVAVAGGTWAKAHAALVAAIEAVTPAGLPGLRGAFVHDGGADIEDPDGGAPGARRFYLRPTGLTQTPATGGGIVRTGCDLVLGTFADDGGDQAVEDMQAVLAAVSAATAGGLVSVRNAAQQAKPLAAEPVTIRGESGAAWRSRLIVEWTT